MALEGVPSFAVWLGSRLIPAWLAFALTISITEHALALDCLAYKPERAVGQWHAEVISGKICWQGPNWRSFLPKSKARVENSKLARSRSSVKPANTGPGTQVVKSEVENKPDMQIKNPKPDSPVVKVENDGQIESGKSESKIVNHENAKPDNQIENSKPEIVTEALDLNRISGGFGKSSSIEAQEFKNAASLEFYPERRSSNHAIPSEPQSMTGLLVAFAVIGLGTVGLVMLLLKDRIQQEFLDADIEEQALEPMSLDAELAPPLQHNADDEPEELEHGILTQSAY